MVFSACQRTSTGLSCRFMKLRLDRVLKVDLGSLSKADALASTGELPEYGKLDKEGWTAPYLPYRPGWWKVFMPEAQKGGQSNGKAQH